jgi:hypothetical protein
MDDERSAGIVQFPAVKVECGVSGERNKVEHERARVADFAAPAVEVAPPRSVTSSTHSPSGGDVEDPQVAHHHIAPGCSSRARRAA